MGTPAKQIYTGLAVAIITFICVFIPWDTVIRFQNPALNSLFVALLALCILALSIASTLVSRHIFLKLLFGTLSFAVIPIALIATFEATDIIKTGQDTSFQKLAELPNASGAIRLYLTDCGATCAYGLVLQEERDMPFGIKLTRKLWSEYRTTDMATLERIDANRVRVTQKSGISHEVYLLAR